MSRAKNWRDEFEELRSIALAHSELTEEMKWGNPCYTFQNKNVVLIHGFKEYCALLFMKGALLKDPHQMLIQQTENVQAARQIRFTNVQEIMDRRAEIAAYIQDAIDIERSGKKVELAKKELVIPEELQQRFNENAELKEAFYKLTPGRQRAYTLHFAQPKKAETREARVEKYIQHILDGKGLND
ncbi:YdeI/OmpD-associated family protein [Alkalicoccobacillus porphyridii]|uniref:YdhG-like domain-containing protein n=1 Tax=Alkalicoccobacillus porphyridii TaxID=2597270 RepID=A0A553ZXD3_9BACI|nr:DUF1801 domain-containing protein [Alkalicoccobacillus porphyridii]TSB46065.1 hypothetical protein FN960_13660 [Alkalicoccobacillus porphyridii]